MRTPPSPGKGFRVDLSLRVALSELRARHVEELAHPRSVVRTQEHVSIHLHRGVVRGQCSDLQGHAWVFVRGGENCGAYLTPWQHLTWQHLPHSVHANGRAPFSSHQVALGSAAINARTPPRAGRGGGVGGFAHSLTACSCRPRTRGRGWNAELREREARLRRTQIDEEERSIVAARRLIRIKGSDVRIQNGGRI